MISRDSLDWPPLKAALEKRIGELHEALAAPTCGIKEADHIRGKIMFAREIIATVEPGRTEIAETATDRRSNY